VQKRSTKARERVRRGLEELKVYQIADGRWIAPVRRAGERPFRIYGATEEQAYANRTAYYTEVAQGLRDSGGEHALVGGKKLVYLEDWLTHWLDHVVKPVYDKGGKLLKGNQPTTHQNYSWHVHANLIPILGRIKLVDLRTSHVEAWYKQLTEQRGVAASSAYEARRTLVTALNVGLKRRHETRLTHNAASAFALKAPENVEKLPPNPEEIARILDCARGERLELTVLCGLFLGLRREEIAALQWRDFDLEHGVVLIRRRMVRIKGQGLVVRGGSKMRADSHVAELPIDPEEWRPRLQAHRQLLLEAYAKYRGMPSQRGGLVWSGPDPRNEDAFLFTTEKGGEKLDPNLIYRFVKSVFTRAGCPAKTLHTLRHDFAGILYDSDEELLTISKLLRHKNIGVTAGIYTHMTERKSRSAIGKAAAWIAQAQEASANGTTG
jgi:integrase